jgi:hypothetical protein
MASPAHHACWIRKEAVMAAVAFNTARQGQFQEQLATILTVFRDMLDAFVSNWMQ